MTKKELKMCGKHLLTPAIAKKLNSLEKSLDAYFLGKKNFNPSQYKAVRKIVVRVLVTELIKPAVTRIQQEVTKCAIDFNELRKKKATANFTKTHLTNGK
jgi:hypothetical protein